MYSILALSYSPDLKSRSACSFSRTFFASAEQPAIKKAANSAAMILGKRKRKLSTKTEDLEIYKLAAVTTGQPLIPSEPGPAKRMSAEYRLRRRLGRRTGASLRLPKWASGQVSGSVVGH